MIRNLKPRAEQYEIFDSKATGLSIRVSSEGTKTFYHCYRFYRKSCRSKIGQLGDVSLKEARQRVHHQRAQIAEGRDPQAERRKKIADHDIQLFANVSSEYIETYAKRNTRSWQETQRILCNVFVSRWRNIRIEDITTQMIYDVLDEVHRLSGPSAARHAFADIRRMLNWAVQRRYIVHSPCAGMKPPAKAKERDRVLDRGELRAVLKAADEIGYPFGNLVTLLILTGQRRNEVGQMKWGDVDLEGGIWTISAASNKSGRKHTVHLSAPAIELLRSIPRIHDVLVFPARGKDVPLSGYSKFKSKID